MARQRIQAIRNFDELKQAYPSFAQASLNQLLLDLTNSGFTLAPTFYKQLQDFMMSIEVDKGLPVSQIAQQPQALPAAQNAFDVGSEPLITTHQAAAEGGGGGGRGGGGGGGGGVAAMSAEEEFYWWKQQQAEAARIEAEQQAQQQAYQAEQDRIQREWQAQQAEIERQNRLRLQRLGDLTQLVGQFAGIQARARETLAGLQGDPFKFASAKLGLASQGVTPGESFRGELNQFIGQPMPQMDPNAPLSAIEQQIQGLSGQMAPQAPRMFGMAGGGEVHGPFQRAVVGEAGEPEIVEGTDFRVIPLSQSSLAGGISGFGATGYSTDSLLPALAPLYAGLGLSSVPKAGSLTPFGQPGFGMPSQYAGLLGYNPRLIRNIANGGTYYRNDADQLQHIQSPDDFAKFGFNWGDVLNVSNPEQVLAFGSPGSPLTAKPQTPVGMPDAFGPLSSPIIEPVTGAILPAPFRAAATLNHLRLTNPQFYQLALSAYANSMSRPGDPNSALGYSQESVEAEMRQALPMGQSHGLIGLR